MIPASIVRKRPDELSMMELLQVDFMLNKIYYSLSMVAFVLSAVVSFYALRFGDVFTQEGIQLLFLELTGAGVT